MLLYTIPIVSFIVTGSFLEYLRPQYPKYFQQEPKLSSIEYLHTVLYSISNVTLIMALVYGTRNWFPQSDFQWNAEGVKLILLFVLGDALFYWSHRVLHIPVVYKYAHKLHHSQLSPIVWSAFYIHPLELVIAIIFFAPLLLIPIATETLITFFTLLFLLLIKSHSGIRFGPLNSEHHDLHHSKFNYNYGTDLNIWDRLVGTTYIEKKILN